MTRLQTRLWHNFVDGALTAAPFVGSATGQPLMAQPVTALERAATNEVCQRSAADAPPWAARAAGHGPHNWGATAFREERLADREQQQLVRAAIDVRSAARVASCGGIGALWTTASAAMGDAAVVPAPGALIDGPDPKRLCVESVLVPDEAARAIMRFRLGIFALGGPCRRLSTDPRAKQTRCPCAAATAQHKVTCPFGPWAIERHNRLARFFQLLVLEIPGASVKWTQRTSFWRQDGGEPGEPDLRIDVPGWEPLYVDVAITFPHSSKEGAAAKVMEREKALKYRVWCAQRRIQPVAFAPLVLESFGRFGPSSAAVVRRLARRSAQDRGASPAAECQRWFQLLGLRLALDQADILLNA